MAFITKQDLHTGMLEEELTEITRGDDVLIQSCIEAAIAEARMYLYDSFEVNQIFAKVGSSRNQLLVQLVCDITLYYVVSRCQAGQELEDRTKRYDRAIDWLKKTAKTEFYADLPRRKETVQSHIMYGGKSKRGNYY